MSTSDFRLRRSQCFRLLPSGSIRVGAYPPVSVEIKSPPTFLKTLVSLASEPVQLPELLEQVLAHCPEAKELEVRDAIGDLLVTGLLQPEREDGRYHRHQLYFDLLGVDSADERALQLRSVGVIGTGGIGSTAAALLAAAGVGKLVLSDGDRVEPSNLTRAVAFDERGVGELKVHEARKRIGALNSSVQVEVVPEPLNSAGFVRENFAGCDILLLSADSPAEVHKWVDLAARDLGVPYINAGYEELWGAIGPLTVPGETACFHCNLLNGNEPVFSTIELNAGFQAPSYGPLNGIVASAAVNEILRHLLGLPAVTLGRRILIDSETYQRHTFEWTPNPACECGAHRDRAPDQSEDKFHVVASQYVNVRESSSLNALVLDELVLALLDRGDPRPVLDLGCGIGTIARELARRGLHVIAVDSSPAMLSALSDRLTDIERQNVSVVRADIVDFASPRRFGSILLNMVLDHIQDPQRVLKNCHGMLEPDSTLIITLPHPFKDAGVWLKDRIASGWRLGPLIVEDYFAEGEISKIREDQEGNEVISGIKSFRRTLATYATLLGRAGLSIRGIHEPQATATCESPVALQKAARIPYFLVLECTRACLDSTRKDLE